MRIWLLIGDKPGDNAQARRIADGLGLPYEIRKVVPKPEFVLGKPKFEISLEHLDSEKSDPLAPPWPDLVITVGRRPAMAALWIQEQAGGQTKIVLLGRPKRWLERFSLVIVPAQYRMPSYTNVMKLDLPLLPDNAEAIRAAGEAWAGRLSGLSRPLIALLVGGQTKPYRFDAAAARDLIDQVAEQSKDGTLYVTTSRRTLPDIVDAIEAGLPDNGVLYRWSADAGENPYQALLALADRFVVTGDSVSMMVEVARCGKPMAIYAPPVAKPGLERLKTGLATALHGDGILAPLGDVLYRAGLVGFARDLSAMHRLFYQRGYAVPLGAPFNDGGITPPDELAPVVERVKQECLPNYSSEYR